MSAIADQILLVEDDLEIGTMVTNYLTMEGYRVVHAPSAEEALRLFAAAEATGNPAFSLILLDLMLPGLTGIDFLKLIREKEKSSVPILIISAKDSDVDKALGLGFGADDYIAKPFSMIELLARVRAAIRRATRYSDTGKGAETAVIHFHELEVDLDNLTVSKNGRSLKLTSKELYILRLFLTNPKKIFTKEQIYRSVWNDDYYGDENIINVHMSRLREKIEDTPSEPKYIKTLWGIGYRLGEQ
ncbi:response regulator transcription factor [Paenibacillus oenotherae]|uniref:Response regulator transcription factor n=1 Tax=Paenibacillus oenotherae TaxID=1435645 RepID=A0ABS7D8Y2_9BACL|nr:response regulator transcription factor [Paenibacillus oenotherae]MBW7476388.1 response regulator transcription factor [Paenibacillus oenotherae]